MCLTILSCIVYFSLLENPIASQNFSCIGTPEPVIKSPESLLSFSKRVTLADMKNMEFVRLQNSYFDLY